MLPLTASAVPEKSILIESPSTVTVALMVMSSSVMPSPSMQSSAECSPSGRSRMASRVRCSA